MKKVFLQEIKRGLMSKEYWFAFILIIVTSAWTAIYNIYGVLANTKIGTAEFFYACIMLGNILLQISVPIIPIFVNIRPSGIYDDINESYSKLRKRQTLTRVLVAITISASVFFLSFLLITIIGIIFFPGSTGDISLIGGPFSDLYYMSPFSLIPITTIFSCVFASVYSLLGMGISMNLKRNKLLALFIPLVYYFCSNYIIEILPSSVQSILYLMFPTDTFILVGNNIPLYKKIIEILFVLVLAVILIFLAKMRNRKIHKTEIESRDCIITSNKVDK